MKNRTEKFNSEINKGIEFFTYGDLKKKFDINFSIFNRREQTKNGIKKAKEINCLENF